MSISNSLTNSSSPPNYESVNLSCFVSFFFYSVYMMSYSISPFLSYFTQYDNPEPIHVAANGIIFWSLLMDE